MTDKYICSPCLYLLHFWFLFAWFWQDVGYTLMKQRKYLSYLKTYSHVALVAKAQRIIVASTAVPSVTDQLIAAWKPWLPIGVHGWTAGWTHRIVAWDGCERENFDTHDSAQNLKSWFFRIEGMQQCPNSTNVISKRAGIIVDGGSSSCYRECTDTAVHLGGGGGVLDNY